MSPATPLSPTYYMGGVSLAMESMLLTLLQHCGAVHSEGHWNWGCQVLALLRGPSLSQLRETKRTIGQHI